MYGIYTIERYEAELIDGAWVRGKLIDVTEEKNNLNVDWLYRIYYPANQIFYRGAMNLAVHEKSQVSCLQVDAEPTRGDWLITTQFATPFYTDAVPPAFGFWTYQGQFDPPGAGQTRYIRAIANVGASYYVLSQVNLGSPCIQDEFTIVLITYRIYTDTTTIIAKGSSLPARAIEMMCADLMTADSPTSTATYPYNADWYPGYCYLGGARTGVTGEMLEIPSMHETSLSNSSSNEFYYSYSGCSSEFGYMQFLYQSNLTHSSGYMDMSGHLIKSLILGNNGIDDRKAFRVPIDTGTTSSIQNTYARSAPNSNLRLPFLDVVNLATSGGTVTMTDDGTWAGIMDDDFIWDYQIQMTTGGNVGASDYTYRKRRMFGGNTSSRAPSSIPLITMSVGYLRVGNDGTHLTLDGTTDTRHGQNSFVVGYASDTGNNNGAANVKKYVFPEIITFDFTGITVTNINNHAFENIDADSTIALAATYILQVENDDLTILAACKSTGLYKISRSAGAVTAITLITPTGVTAGSGCQGITVKAPGEWWGLWNDATNAKLWLGKTTDSGANWTLYDEGTGTPFAITGYTSGSPGRDNVIGLKVHTFAKIIAAQTHANYNGAGLNGSFAAGTGYSTGLVTMNDGATITINSIGGGGEVLTFTVTTGTPEPSTNPYKPGDTIPATTGSGFSITPGHNNLINNLFVLGAPTLNISAAGAPHGWEDQSGTTTIGYISYSSLSCYEAVGINKLHPLSNGKWWANWHTSSFNNVMYNSNTTLSAFDIAATSGWNTVASWNPILIDDLPGDNTTYMVGSATTTPAASGPHVLRTPAQFNVSGYNYATLYDAAGSSVTETPGSALMPQLYNGISGAGMVCYVGEGVFITKESSETGKGFAALVFNGTGLISNDDLCLHWHNYGWNGSAWVEDYVGSRTTHATTETLENGLSVTFDDSSGTAPFVINEFYDVYVADGILKDSGTTFTQKTGVYTTATTSGSGTSPSSVPGTDIGAVIAEPIVLLNSGTSSVSVNRSHTTLNWYALSYGEPGRIHPYGISSGYAPVCEHQLVGDFEARFKINNDYSATNTAFMPGVGLATWSAATADPVSGIPTSDAGFIKVMKHRLTGVDGPTGNIDYELYTTNSCGSTGAILEDTITNGSVADIFTIRRVGTAIDFIRNSDPAFYSTTSSADLALVVCGQYSGAIYDMEIDYTINRRYVDIGNGTTTGPADPNFRTIAWPTIDNDMIITIDGVPATILTDGVTAPASGEVNVLPYSGRLWLNSADAGLAITCTWRYLLNINLV